MTATRHLVARALRACFALACVPLATGCGSVGASLGKATENRVVCTLAHDHAMVVSQWGLFGLASSIRKEDAEIVCPPLQ